MLCQIFKSHFFVSQFLSFIISNIILFYIYIFQNLSQQSDISDLLGGFKPTDARSICFPLYMEFKDLFSRSFSAKVCLLLCSHIVILH